MFYISKFIWKICYKCMNTSLILNLKMHSIQKIYLYKMERYFSLMTIDIIEYMNY